MCTGPPLRSARLRCCSRRLQKPAERCLGRPLEWERGIRLQPPAKKLGPEAPADTLREHAPLMGYTGRGVLRRADEWVVDYYDYVPGHPDDAVFATPKLCKGVQPASASAKLRYSPHGLRMRSLVPEVKYSEWQCRGGLFAFERPQ